MRSNYTLDSAARLVDLTDAIALATRAHDGQLDKTGVPYILHPRHVMMAVSPAARVVAVLHDVIEDTDYDVPALRNMGLDHVDLHSVIYLTRLTEPEGCVWCLEYRRSTAASPQCAHCQDTGKRPTYRQYIDNIANAPEPYGSIVREVKIADIRHNMSPARSYDGAKGMAEKRYIPALAQLMSS
jgi:hypothetical protein